jgi:hypothetical protein
VTPSEAVLAKYPDAQANCFQSEAHVVEGHERQLHWAESEAHFPA